MNGFRLPPPAALVCLGLLLAGCGGKPPAAGSPDSAVPAAAAPAVTGLETVDLDPGSGAPIAAGQKAVVHYTGCLYETSAPEKKGRQFDSSRNAGQPFSFVVGAGQVIKGWDQGVLGMKVGGRRRLTIPAELGYGDIGSGNVIPPGAALVFEVELLAVE
ncbi:MAG TPA: FKBP-type peptidyl-prolyl cis-trans isomerase [Steroidobacteraceae bacterium]|nr:FKBP-type peptidyl-prolyl cis-trans isomerase [Steroidobacteraceae bacterium]